MPLLYLQGIYDGVTGKVKRGRGERADSIESNEVPKGDENDR